MMDNKDHINPEYHRLLHEQQERLKELACINQTTYILKEGKPIEETLQQITLLLPAAWQYPEFTNARIKYLDKIFETPEFSGNYLENDAGIHTIDDEMVQLRYFIIRNSASKMKVRF